jgi:hypothetical protein
MSTSSTHETNYLIAVVVASNSERQAGIILPAVWPRVFPNQPQLGATFVARTNQERNVISVERTKHFLVTLGLEIQQPNHIFFVRQVFDKRNQLRAVVCAEVVSLEPLKKRYVPLVRVPFPIIDNRQTRQKIIEEILAF